jgi:hypothetical protein
MCKHISKALTHCSAAIRTALGHYNKLAPRQKPPCPKLEYSDVIGYSTLGEFSLLKTSHPDVLTKPWAQPANREMSMTYFKVVRSKEEIIRLNVEIHRLAAWVDYDEKQIVEAEEKFQDASSDGLAAEMRLLYAERHRVNNIHRQTLCKIYKLDGYSDQMPEGRIQEEGREVDNGNKEEDVTDVIKLTDSLERIN